MPSARAGQARDPVRSRARLLALRRLQLVDCPAEPPFDRLTRLAARIVDAPIALVSLVEADRQFFLSAIGLPEPWSVCRQTPLSHSFCQHVVRSREPLAVEDARTDDRVSGNPAIADLGVVAYLGMPLMTESGHVLGSFCVIDSKPRTWSATDQEILRDLAASVLTEIELRAQARVRHRAVAALRRSRRRLAALLSLSEKLCVDLERQRIALADANQQLAELATTDGLTGLGNRRHFDESLRNAFALMERRDEPVSVILADVDSFKQYNDTYGHPAGDQVLQAVASVFREQVRTHETVARYGGEEFAVILLGADTDAALAVAERLRAAVEARNWPRRAVTISLGVATSRPGMGSSELLHRADQALYLSKRQGRNRATAYGSGSELAE